MFGVIRAFVKSLHQSFAIASTKQKKKPITYAGIRQIPLQKLKSIVRIIHFLYAQHSPAKQQQKPSNKSHSEWLLSTSSVDTFNNNKCNANSSTFVVISVDDDCELSIFFLFFIHFSCQTIKIEREKRINHVHVKWIKINNETKIYVSLAAAAFVVRQ